MSSNDDGDDNDYDGSNCDETSCQLRGDQLMEAISFSGRWQLRTCLLLTMASFVGSWHILAINFQAPPVSFRCMANTRANHSKSATGTILANSVTGTDITSPTNVTASAPRTIGVTDDNIDFKTDAEHRAHDITRQNLMNFMSSVDQDTAFFQKNQCHQHSEGSLHTTGFNNELPQSLDQSVERETEKNHTMLSNSTQLLQKDCSSWLYDESQCTSTIVTEWNLVCGRAWLHKVSQSIFMIGIMAGVMLWGAAADKYGRRPVLLSCSVLTFIFSLANTTSVSIEMFLALRFLTAFSDIGAYMAAFTIAMELVDSRPRTYLGVFFSVPASFGFITLSGVCFFVRSWRTIQLIVSFLTLFYGVYYWAVPESPRWLQSVNRDEEAELIVREICVYNGTEVPEKLQTEKSTGKAKQSQMPQERFVDIFRSRRMMVSVLALQFCWFVVGMVFYGILLNTEDFGNNIYLNGVLAGAVELPAMVICALCVDALGRRLPIMMSMLVTGISCLLTLVFRKGEYAYDWPIVMLAMSGKFGASAAFSAIYTISSEMFPTTIRNTGLGLCSVMARIGSILAPFMFFIRDVTFASSPIVMFGTLALLSSASVLLLPETANQRLASTIADITHDERRWLRCHIGKWGIIASYWR